MNRFCQTESRWGYSGTSDRLRFMVNRKIFIVGFGLYGSIHGATEYAVNMQVMIGVHWKGDNDDDDEDVDCVKKKNDEE